MIELMFNKKRYSCTRDTAKEYEQWAITKILELKAGKKQPEIKKSCLFRELVNIHFEKVGRNTPSMKAYLAKVSAIDKIIGELADKQIHEITPQDLTSWRNKRLKEVSAGTVLKEISLFSSVFSFAQKELFLIEANPFFSVSKPTTPESRHRRIAQDEIELIKKEFRYERIVEPKTTQQYVAWAFLFAIETAMRRGEILNMTKQDIYDDHVHIPKSKNGTKRDVPLSKKAKELLGVLKLEEGQRVIPCTENAFRISWERKKKAIGLSELHFHDTRHEAISRMVRDRGLPVQVLAKITEHKKIEVLVNTYYNPSTKEMVDMFNG